MNKYAPVFNCAFPFLVHANDHFKGLPRMEALVRIANIPIVESGVKTAGQVYLNLKVCNIHIRNHKIDVQGVFLEG